jgi:polar amino acid transport system substrate-binding protein
MLDRRALLASAAALLAGAARPLRAAERPSAAADIQRILERGRLVVAVAGFPLPPFVMADAAGQLAGYDIDLANGMARALGVPASFDSKAQSVEAVLAAVARGDADLALSKLGATLDGARSVRFSRPYLTLQQALLVNRPRFAQAAGSRDPAEVVQKPNTPIGVVAGTASAEDARRRWPRAQLRDYPHFDPDLVDAVLAGAVLAGCGDELEVRHALAARTDAPLHLRAAILPETRLLIAAALPPANAQLFAWVDLYIETALVPVPVEELLARYAAKPPE